MELYPIRIDVLYPPIVPSSSAAVTTSSSTVATAATPSDGASVATTSSNNKALPPMIRIIDTLLIDPKLLSDGDLHQRNAVFTQWAHSIISDAFVVGVTKSPATTTAASTTTTPTGNGKKDEFSGRYTITDTTSAASNVAALPLQNCIACYNSLMQQATQQMQTQFSVIQNYEQLIQRYKQNDATAGGTKDTLKATLIPIQLRMEIPSTGTNSNRPPVRYHDDFLWDHSNQLVSPLQMAQSIVNDLQLSRDTVPIITIHILEQIIQHCVNATAWSDKNVPDVINVEDDEGFKMGPPILLQQQQLGALGQPSTKNIKATAAWEISQAVHNTNIVHLETIHKKQPVTTTPK